MGSRGLISKVNMLFGAAQQSTWRSEDTDLLCAFYKIITKSSGLLVLAMGLVALGPTHSFASPSDAKSPLGRGAGHGERSSPSIAGSPQKTLKFRLIYGHNDDVCLKLLDTLNAPPRPVSESYRALMTSKLVEVGPPSDNVRLPILPGLAIMQPYIDKPEFIPRVIGSSEYYPPFLFTAWNVADTFNDGRAVLNKFTPEGYMETFVKSDGSPIDPAKSNFSAYILTPDDAETRPSEGYYVRPTLRGGDISFGRLYSALYDCVGCFSDHDEQLKYFYISENTIAYIILPNITENYKKSSFNETLPDAYRYLAPSYGGAREMPRHFQHGTFAALFRANTLVAFIQFHVRYFSDTPGADLVRADATASVVVNQELRFRCYLGAGDLADQLQQGVKVFIRKAIIPYSKTKNQR